MRKYFVKGGPESHGQHGFIFSNANWDPYPMANEVEALTTALANMDVAVVQRIYRFSSTFFTVIAPKDVLNPEQLEASVQSDIDGYNPTAIWQDIESLAPTLTPEGNPISNDVEELQAQTVLKATRARRTLDDTALLLGEDLLTATYWMDIRRVQSPDATSATRPRPPGPHSVRPCPGSRNSRVGPPTGERHRPCLHDGAPGRGVLSAAGPRYRRRSNEHCSAEAPEGISRHEKPMGTAQPRCDLAILTIAGASIFALPAAAQGDLGYHPIDPDRGRQDGHADRARHDHR